METIEIEGSPYFTRVSDDDVAKLRQLLFEIELPNGCTINSYTIVDGMLYEKITHTAMKL